MKNLANNIKNIFHLVEDSVSRPGIAIGIVSENEDFFFCHGNASLSSLDEITKETSFHLASLTKFFTAQLFKKAEKSGLISRKMPLSLFFNFPGIKDYDITFEHLLGHQSGLRDQWDLTRLGGWNSHDPISNQDILNLIELQTSINFTPGSKYCYNNTGYTLLGIALEKVTKRPITDLLKEYLFDDVSIKSTSYYSFKDVLRHFAVGYKKKTSDQYQIDIPQLDVIGSTSMYSSVEELLKFERSYLSQNFLIDSSEKENGVFYKDGLIHVVQDDKRLELHSGWDYGYSSFLLRLRHKKVSLVILSNMGKSNLFQEAIEIISVLDDDLANIDPLGQLLNKSISVNHIRPLEGYFINADSNTIYNVSSKGNYLYLNSDRLTPISKVDFVIGSSLNKISFLDNSNFEISAMGFKTMYQKIENKKASNQSDYCGEYFSKELCVYYNLFILNELLIIQLPKQKKVQLTQINAEFFIAEDIFVKFSFRNGIVDGFIISTMRSWNILFKKTDSLRE